MHLNLKKLQKRLGKINQLRLDRASVGMTDSFQQVYRLLPVLLHFNHPQLPGYVNENTPQGIANYQPTGYQLHYLENQQLPVMSENSTSPPIAGLFSMGSTSSIGQSFSSDLDIWVCVETWLSNDARLQLQQKCDKIELWANALGVDISFFIVDENRFRDHEHGCLEGENCGSSLHILLLEEFYRTKTRLAGKPILWNIIPLERQLGGQRYETYQEYATALATFGVINRDEWIDFGPLTNLSAEEFFGASLWQLYKSVDSPYKAVLKTLMLETYSAEYPNTKLLALEMKERVHAGNEISFDSDAYYIMLVRVTKYLQSIHDHKRLDLARRCFYMKVKEKLSLPTGNPTWRREILSQLVDEWGWSQKIIEKLDNRLNWKIEQVREAHEELLEAMMLSYRNLINFGRRNNLNSSISPQDIGVLTRKLYASFEVLPGKITLLNPRISPDLAEPTLTFVHVDEGNVNRAGWYVYKQPPKIESIIGHQPLEHANYLSKLVSWCYFNGLLVNQTQLYLHSHCDCDLQKLSTFVKDIATYFPKNVPVPTRSALYNPCEIRRLAIIINLDKDPTKRLNKKEIEKIEPLSLDVLSYGDQQRSLIGSVDLLYRNSWNEVRTLHFDKELCVLDALKTVLGKMHQDADVPESVEIFCYSEQLSDAIKQRVKKLISECVMLRLSTTQQNQSRFKPLHIAGETWGLFFERLGVTAHKFDNAVDFYGAISNNKLQGTALNFTSTHDDLPPVIYGFASEGIIQFFFEQADPGFNVYILNENNQIEIYRHCDGSMENMVRDVNRFYALSQDRLSYSYSAMNFNLPQFYQLVTSQDGQKQVIPFFSSETNYIPNALLNAH